MPEENSELVRLAAEKIDTLPTLADVDEMIAAARALPPSPNREESIDELLDFRSQLTSVQAELDAQVSELEAEAA